MVKLLVKREVMQAVKIAVVRVSVVDALKSPTPASINRKRAVRTNAPPTGKNSCQGSTASDLKKVTPAQLAK